MSITTGESTTQDPAPREPASGEPAAGNPAAADVHGAWRQLAGPFTAEVEAVRDWSAASPCAGWTARDVLDHVRGTQREFLAGHSLMPETAAGSADGDPAVAGADGDPAAQWAAHLTAVEVLLADPEIAGREYDGAFGPTTIGATLLEFYGVDLLLHRWDLGTSQGRDVSFTPREIDVVDAAVDAWGEHAYGPGIFAAPLPVAEGADARTRLLARTGRAG